MLEKGRRSGSSQFIPTRCGKTLSHYLLRASDIKKNITHLRALHVQIFKRMGKSLPELCAPKAKFPTLNYWFPAKVSSIFENTEERMKKSVQLTLR